MTSKQVLKTPPQILCLALCLQPALQHFYVFKVLYYIYF